MKRYLFQKNILLHLVASACLFLASFPAIAAHPIPDVQDNETKAQRDARMAWWREARFGMFIHWGLYAVPAGVWNGKPVDSLGEWIMNTGHIPVADYKAFTGQFNPTSFDADAWVTLAKTAGMKYIVITAKHHDGFAMYKSDANPFNIVDATPFKRDPLKELAIACQKQGIKFGFYYSQDQDWTAPGGSAMGAAGHWDPTAQDGNFETYQQEKVIPQLSELLTNYQPAPAVIWFDTPTQKMTPKLASGIVALLNKHPELIWNNRLGGSYRGDTETPEQRIPPHGYPGRDWETCMTINDTWGYKTGDTNFKSTTVLLRNLIDIASKGGNYLLNIGPDATGVIPGPEAERLREIGKWIQVNGEAIYGTQATPFNRSFPWGCITRKGDNLYLHIFDWPAEGKLLVPLHNKATKAFLLASPGVSLPTAASPTGIEIQLRSIAPDPVASVVVLQLDGPADPLPAPPHVQNADGTIPLNVVDADILTTDKESSPEAKLEGDTTPNIGYWTHASDYLIWNNINVTKPGTFDVSLTYGAAPNSDGNEFTLTVNDQTMNGVLSATGNYNTYKTATVGTISVANPGIVSVTLKPTKVNGSFCNLQAVTLVPKP